jgi:transposase-like protein
MSPTNDFYRVDETCAKIKGEWEYLYSAARFDGTNDRYHVEREKRCEGRQTVLPQDAQGRIARINVDQNLTYPPRSGY